MGAADTHPFEMSCVVWGIQVNIGQHRSECSLPPAASLNYLVSPSSRESRPYAQASLYIQFLLVPSLAVHSSCLLQCRSNHHYSGHGKQYCILPHHCWSIRSVCSSWNFHLIWVSPHSQTSKPPCHLHGIQPPLHESSSSSSGQQASNFSDPCLTRLDLVSSCNFIH